MKYDKNILFYFFLVHIQIDACQEVV